MKTKLFAAWLCLTLVSAAMAVTLDTGGNVEGKETILDEITYIISEPFRINNNTDFATSPKVTGGDGSAGNPWIIENYEIDGTGYGYCIYIGNTTEHFVVRDCLLHNASGHNEWPWFNNAGITLNNIVNGVFQNNTARECEYGYITIEWIRDLNFIKNNAFNNSRDGIRFLRGYNCTIHNNVANDNGNAGIAVLSSRQIRIENNT
ncbi:MAG: right-handed parallel beta-helix repeat-containing protein, partial [Euryarchaeota archaeon]|nr:right-handed parallel beta-helix repeat-containing protein [Euryarchaeota archaeon]